MQQLIRIQDFLHAFYLLYLLRCYIIFPVLLLSFIIVSKYIAFFVNYEQLHLEYLCILYFRYKNASLS